MLLKKTTAEQINKYTIGNTVNNSTIHYIDQNVIQFEISIFNSITEEEFEDTKGVVRICKSRGQTTQWTKEKVQMD